MIKLLISHDGECIEFLVVHDKIIYRKLYEKKPKGRNSVSGDKFNTFLKNVDRQNGYYHYKKTIDFISDALYKKSTKWIYYDYHTSNWIICRSDELPKESVKTLHKIHKLFYEGEE